jgi:hypothetical protein
MPKPTKEEAEHMAKVAALGCYVWHKLPKYKDECGGRAEVHHKLGESRNHFKVTCLCTNHHSAQTPLPFGHAVHKGTKSFEARYATQAAMVEWANNLVG